MIDYRNKIVTANEAVKKGIRNGDHIVLAHAAGFPIEIVSALADQSKDLKDISVFHLVSLGEEPLVAKGIEKNIRLRVGFLGSNTRDCIAECRGDFLPVFFHEVPRFLKEGKIGCDVAVISVTPPNEEGYCSYGVSCDYTKPSAEVARTVIAVMNKQMPFISGDNFIHVSKIDYIVEADRPLFEIPNPSIGEVEKGIGKNVASLVKDGSTLQLGIGAIPDAVLLFLDDKKDLGIHTEMFSSGAVNLIKKGVINGSKKEIGKGKHVATFLMGNQELYEYVNNNPDVELAPVDYVNHPATVMKLDNIVSINSCVEVDLMGQVCSESIGPMQISGVGGQVDYVRGAAMAKNGISIIAIPSTARKETSSRIVANLAPGAAITTSRNDVDYIVTEYGIAKLKGCSLRERAKALIAISHPKFRPELQEEFNRRFCK